MLGAASVAAAAAVAAAAFSHEGGGIYRHTRVIVTEPVAIAHDSVYVPSEVTGAITRDTAGARPTADATVTIQANVTASSSSSSKAAALSDVDDLSFAFEIFDPTGASVWKGSATVASGTASTTAELKAASLWEQPLDNSPTAALYTLMSTLSDKDGAVDAVNTTFGIRKLNFDANRGFLLNDQHVKVKGMCNHQVRTVPEPNTMPSESPAATWQDFAGVGTAVPDRIEDFRVAKLQSFGANAWRMSHNPPNPELLDAADRRGLLVWDVRRHLYNLI